MFCFLGQKAYGILTSQAELEPAAPALEGELSTTGPLGKLLSAALNLLPFSPRLRASPEHPQRQWYVWKGLDWLVFLWRLPRHCRDGLRRFKVEGMNGDTSTKSHRALSSTCARALPPQVCSGSQIILTLPVLCLPWMGCHLALPTGIISQTVTVTDNEHKPSIFSCQQLSNTQKGACVDVCTWW